MTNIARLLMTSLSCLLAVTMVSCAQGESTASSISWFQCLNQKPEFYSSDGRTIPGMAKDYPDRQKKRTPEQNVLSN